MQQLAFYILETTEAQLVERWSFDEKLQDNSNPAFEGPCETISIVSSLYAIPVNFDETQN